MNKSIKLVTIILPLILLGMISLSKAAESSIISLTDIKTPNALENIKVIKLSTDKNSSNYLIYIKKNVPMHKHLKHSESIYVISGEGIFTLDEEKIKIKSGDFIHVPEGTLHAVKVTSESPLKVLSNQAPEFFGNDRVHAK